MSAENFLKQIRKLPPNPQMLPKLQQLLRGENATVESVADLLKIDAALTTQVIKLSNSSYYGAKEQSYHIGDAVSRIGTHEVYKIVAIASTQDTFNGSLPVYKMPKGYLWKLSALTARCMQAFADRYDLDDDDVYTVGLLHSLGKVIIQSYYAEKGLPGYESENHPKGLTTEDEEKLLGFNHGELAYTLLKNWGFPDTIYEPIRSQFDPKSASSYQSLAYLLCLCKEAAVTALAKGKAAEPPPNNTLLECTGITAEELLKTVEHSIQSLELIEESV